MEGINPHLKSYAVVVVTVGSALLLTLLLQPLLTPTIFSLFFGAVTLSAWYSGIVPGLIATALSTLAIGYFLLKPLYSYPVYGIENILLFSIFVLVIILLAWLNYKLHTAKQYQQISLQQQKTSSEERCCAFLEQSTEGIWCLELEVPISSACSEDEQIQHFYQYAYLKDCNAVTAQMYGFSCAEEIFGTRLKDFLAPSQPNNIEYLRNFIRSGYRLIDAESYEIDKYGNSKYFLNNLVGILENGTLVRAWGTQRDITERKRIEEALRESENRFRALADATIEGVVIHENGKILDANPAFARIFGYDFNEVIGKSAADFLTSESQKIVLEKILSGDEKPYEVIGIKKDGTHINLEVIGRGSIYQGQAVRVASVRDITELKQTEQALRQREEELRLITNAVPVFISYVDTQQRYRFNNKKYEEWFGLPATEIYGKHLKEIMGESVYESVRPFVETALSGKQVNYESQLPAADGSMRYVHVSYVPHYHQGGQVEGFVALINDITERKIAEIALVESEERFRKLAEKVRVIPWEADAITGNFTYVGPQSVDILGYPLSDWFTHNFWTEHIHPLDREWTINFCLNCLHTLDNYEFEYRMLAADGSVVWLYDIVNVVRDEDSPKLLRGLMIDITDRKLAEKEREQLLERERTVCAEAETANRIKDEFLATLSHELRTPLNAMLGWTQLLKSRKFDEATTARALETIDRNTKSLTMLIEDVLNVSHIIRGKLELCLRPVELVSVVKAALDIVRPAADAKEIYIEYQFDPTVGIVIGDANRLQQIVWNLLANAVKFTPQGGKVDVQIRRIDSGVQIRVCDTGEGISPDFLPYVFDRFRQADSSSTRSHGGLGLGLAIVRHLVESHGGTVSAHSLGIGQGATFIVNLPMKAVDVETTKPKQFSSIIGDERVNKTIPSLAGLRILVVDDEADARDLLLTILQEYQAEVMVVASVREALDTLPHFLPDVLVSDIVMPQEDGYMLIRQVRSLPQHQGGRTPAVALTAHATPEDRTQALLAGFQIHVPKPVNPTELVVVVANIAGRSENN